jgi:uncharacterized protein with PhoU and TrkA domain
MQLDTRMRELEDDIQEMAVQNAVEDRDIKKALLIIRLAHSVGDISGGAMKIADVVRRDVPPHPVIQLSLRETDVIITTVTIGENSDLAGATRQGQAGHEHRHVRHRHPPGRRYIYGPDQYTSMMEGDTLYVRGPVDGEQYLRELANGTVHLEPKDLK